MYQVQSIKDVGSWCKIPRGQPHAGRVVKIIAADEKTVTVAFTNHYRVYRGQKDYTLTIPREAFAIVRHEVEG